MTLTKAIEILTDLLRRDTHASLDDQRDAVQLGIEALKRILDVRRFPEASNWKPHPGETEEEHPTREEVKKYMAELK